MERMSVVHAIEALSAPRLNLVRGCDQLPNSLGVCFTELIESGKSRF